MDELNNNERPTNDKIEKIKKFVKENKEIWLMLLPLSTFIHWIGGIKIK